METLLQEASKWYPDFMLQKLPRATELAGVSCKIAVLDGNMKLNGRICAEAHAEVEYSPGLKMACSLLQWAASFQETQMFKTL